MSKNHKRFEISVSLSPNRSRFGPLLFSGDLETGLGEVKKFGYTGVELSLKDSGAIDHKALINQLNEFGLKLYAIATGQSYYEDGFSLFGNTVESRENAVKRICGHINLASKLSAAVIVGGIRGSVDRDVSDWDKMIDDGKEALRECLIFAQKAEVTLLLEPINRYETTVVNTLKEGLQYIHEMGSPNLKLLPDTFHMNIEEASITDSLKNCGSSLGYIHFADSNRLAPGWGHIDFKEVLNVLKNSGYNGPVGVEILPKPNDIEACKQAIEYIKSLNSRNSDENRL